ncbi:hypothetical protein JXO59_01780, partial [candidate division KSB1 bacterium]|nr:hypothetical protein [candidate division KSB1 bacterium]
CNLMCPGCPYHSEATHRQMKNSDRLFFPLDALQRLVSDLKKLGTHKIQLTGSGEPMLHPDFFAIMALLN